MCFCHSFCIYPVLHGVQGFAVHQHIRRSSTLLAVETPSIRVEVSNGKYDEIDRHVALCFQQDIKPLPNKELCTTLSDLLENTHLPWLVPATSVDELEAKIRQAGADLFHDLPIAGIVPERTGGNLVALAMPWKEGTTDPWHYEFRVGTASYSAAEGCTDLHRKLRGMVKEDS